MLRAILTQKNGRKMMLLGLDAENVKRLQDGMPIRVNGNEYGMNLDIDVLIMYGETMSDVTDTLVAAGMKLPANS